MNRYVDTCARCDRPDRQVARCLNDGPLCAACHAKAMRTTGTCASCTTERLTPGVDEQGRPICLPCSGIDTDYHCSRCGKEWILRYGLCEWCHFSDMLDSLLDGPADLEPLRARLLEAPRPDSLIIWLYDRRVRQLLADISHQTELTHEWLDTLRPPRSVNHLRALLVSVGLIPARDEQLARFDRLAADVVTSASEGDRDLLARFSRWQLRTHLVAASERKPLTDGQITNATQKLRVARDFLAWLRANGSSLGSLTQALLETWFTTPPSTRRSVTTFMRWALTNRECPRRIKIPKDIRGDRRTLSQQDRLDLLARLLLPETGSLTHRAAGILLVLLGQPYTRIVTMTVDDISTGPTGDVLIRLPGGTVPLPHPFGAVFTQLVQQRPNMNTATNHTSRWLFPGRRADRPANATGLRTAGMKMGIDLTPSKRSALRQLVQDAPPPVVADMLGYSYQTLDRHAQEAGSRYRSYAAARHL